MNTLLARSGLASVVLSLTACATTGSAPSSQATSASASSPTASKDPIEGVNRKIFAFNEKLDQYALKPLAQGYKKIVPQPVRNGVDNFFGNIGDAWSAVNHLLQGHVATSAEMGMRFASNTVFGLGGILDPATQLGMERHSTDFGITLGHWGFGPGPYLVLPILGPSDLRDTAALPLNYAAGTSAWIHGPQTLTDLTVLNVVSTRAGFLSAGNVLDDIALDKYGFLRDAYLARRRNLVFDGNPPDEPDPADTAEPPAAPASAASASQ
jgi:phospholipid-binding lipoprotein MlaA